MDYSLYKQSGTPYVLNPSRNYGALDTMYTDYEKWQSYVLNNYHRRQKTNSNFAPSQYDFKDEESIYMLREMLFKYINQSHIKSQFERPVLDRFGIIRIAPKNLNDAVITDIKCKL